MCLLERACAIQLLSLTVGAVAECGANQDAILTCMSRVSGRAMWLWQAPLLLFPPWYEARSGRWCTGGFTSRTATPKPPSRQRVRDRYLLDADGRSGEHEYKRLYSVHPYVTAATLAPLVTLFSVTSPHIVPNIQTFPWNFNTTNLNLQSRNLTSSLLKPQTSK